MRQTDPEGHGPVRYGPPLPGQDLPVPPGLAAAATGAHTEPTGGDPPFSTPPSPTGPGADCPPTVTGRPRRPAPPHCSSR